MTKKGLLTESVSIDELTPHPKNVRQGDIGAISESLKAHGQYRAIVAQRSTGHILAGNHTWKAAKALGWKEIAVHWADCDNDTALRILVADNRANDLATYDDTALAELLKEINATELGLDGTLFDGDALDQLVFDLNAEELLKEQENAYTQAVKVPQYDIVGERPAPTELYDKQKHDRLVADIDKAAIPEDIKDFLRLAATRHIVFNYQKVAEFYPHCTEELQALMEDSVLIIIDAEDAIAKGYASFASTIEDLKHRDEE